MFRCRAHGEFRWHRGSASAARLSTRQRHCWFWNSSRLQGAARRCCLESLVSGLRSQGKSCQLSALRKSADAFGIAAFGIIRSIRDHGRVVVLALGKEIRTQAGAIDGKFQKSSRMDGIVYAASSKSRVLSYQTQETLIVIFVVMI